jgi:hypothetical protein
MSTAKAQPAQHNKGELTHLQCANRLLREGLKSIEAASKELEYEPADYGTYCQMQLVVINIIIIRSEMTEVLRAMRKRKAA